MTPAKRRPATAASEGPTDELVTVPVPPPATKDSTQLLGPEGVPIAQDPPGDAAGGDSAPPKETGHVAPEDRATKQSPGRRRARHPERVWPD